MRLHAVTLTLTALAAGLLFAARAAAASEATLEVAALRAPLFEPSSVDTVSCNTPLKGNACLLVTCGNCANEPIGASGGDFVLNVTNSLLNDSGYGGCTIKDLNSAVYLTHQRTGDINVQLARGNTSVIKWTGQGTCNATTLDATFDDEAGGAINKCPPSGVMRSNDPLNAFDGDDLVAAWTLSLGGNGSTAGTLRGWKLAADVSCTDIPPAASCSPNATTACLKGDRFRVRMTWQTPGGSTGSGRANELTPDTGWFWFFDPANVEVVLKVIDACSFNDRFWVFAAGLTNVRVVITVTDTKTGRSKTYTNPQNTDFQPILDTDALACP
jgi:hypothetical protein